LVVLTGRGGGYGGNETSWANRKRKGRKKKKPEKKKKEKTLPSTSYAVGGKKQGAPKPYERSERIAQNQKTPQIIGKEDCPA